MADDPNSKSASGLNQVLTQAGTLWNKLPKRRRGALVATVAVVLGGVLFLSLRSHPSGWSPLLERVTPEDAVELTSALDGRGIAHHYADDGATIEVETEHLAEARVVLASAGLPHAGAGFELFDHASLGQSSFAEQVEYRRALQGELSRSITTLAQVEGARVHVALGRRSVMKDADEPPSASVALRLHAGQHLSSDQVRGVKQLVAASVEGLTPEAVVVLDDHGDILDGEARGLANRDGVEQDVAQRVRSMLEKIVGHGHVVVVANAEIDTSKVNQTEDLYDKDKTALRSEARTVEGDPAGNTIGGVAGVRGNLPGAPGGAAGSGAGSGEGRLQETKNYEVSHIVRQTVGPAARVQKLHLAILVDEKVDAKGQPIARTPDELAQLTALAKEAAGLDDARGDRLEIRSVKFMPDDDLGATGPAASAAVDAAELPWLYIAGGGGGLVLLLIIGGVLLAMSKRARKRQADDNRPLSLPAPLAEVERILSSPPTQSSPGVPSLPAPRGAHDRVLDTMRADVNRAARVLSGWLGEGGSAPRTNATSGGDR
jgi:flagellar M-ring protein FliF